MWDLGWIRAGERDVLPAGLDDPRPGIWISYVPVDEVGKDVSRLVRMSGHRLVALPQHPFEVTKIGAGPPPRRVPEGWLLLHHGVSGEIASLWFCAAAGSGLLRRSDDPFRR